MMGRSCRLMLVALSACAAHAVAAEDIGRLFLTPQQRQDLDRRRSANIQEALVVTESTSTVQGRVSRSSGKTTTWINRVPVHDSHPGADPATVSISTGEGQPDVTLRIGQTYDNARGEIRDPLAGGKVKIEGAKRPAP